MSTENAIQPIVSGMPLTKAEQASAAQQIIDRIKNGDVDAIAAYTQIKSLVESLTLVLKDKDVVSATIASCETYGKPGANYGGARLTVCETGVRYDYSVCGDPLWNNLSQQKKEIEKQLKERETFLFGIHTPQTIVDENTGEVSTLVGPAKTSSTSVKVTFAK